MTVSLRPRGHFHWKPIGTWRFDIYGGGNQTFSDLSAEHVNHYEQGEE